MEKSELLKVLHLKIDDKISQLQKLIDETRASNNDTKSSMGDKYETGREMLQQEINNLQVQLNEVLKQKTCLQTLVIKKNNKVEKGALITTEKGMFFIAVSVGEVLLSKQKIICISTESPLAKAMAGLSKNEVFTLNGTVQTIVDVC
ncbi:MAG: hypothetical protein BGO40_01330 [Chryseobacterium sp. 39-10]|nr:hypothetical protein [Chryseobacterium sp.]OJV46931.1 MAG: hypothetical protein BGO40_01330 [Chryseobacterium sp. 39-10]